MMLTMRKGLALPGAVGICLAVGVSAHATPITWTDGPTSVARDSELTPGGTTVRGEPWGAGQENITGESEAALVAWCSSDEPEPATEAEAAAGPDLDSDVPAGVIPEPATMSLLALGSLLVLARRGRR